MSCSNFNVLIKLGIILSCCFLFFSCRQSTNKWQGTFEGTSTESSQVGNELRRIQNGETKHFPGGRSTSNDTINLTQENNVTFVAINENCKLRLVIDDATNAHISEGQACQISMNGFEGKVTMTGRVFFEKDNKLMIEFKGAAAESNTNGEYIYNFQGKTAD